MKYTTLTEKDFQHFSKLLSSKRILTDEENLLRCASDKTEDLVFKPQVVLQPISTKEVSEILKYCHQNRIPIVPRGAGTGLSGGALPIFGGVVLDMQKMNKILNIDVENFQVTTEPGIITEELMNAVKEKGLFYPVDPASKGSCFIGGNIAENSGGARAVKYGVVKDQVLNLEIVLPNGEIMWTGANTLKNSTGYNLTQLMVGSEGTLAVITKIVLKLLKIPTKDLLIFVPFNSAEEACEAVHKIFMAGFTPSALEFMERKAIDIAQQYIGKDFLKLDKNIQAGLLIEVDGNDENSLLQEIEGIFEVLEKFKTGEILFADNNANKEKLWKIRTVMGEAAKSASIYKEEDTVVPRAKLPLLIKKVKTLGKEYGFDSVIYGHAGDGNLHINILKNEMSDDKWKNVLPQAIRKIFEYTHSLGGTISGEHGIGFVQKEYMNTVFSKTHLEIQKQIKEIFDPHHILNPGKIF